MTRTENRYFALKYMKEFKCVGPTCEDTCCQGWQVFIEKNDYESVSQKIGSNVNLHEKFKNMLIFNPETTQKIQPYALMDFKRSTCRLLEGGLCLLHNEFSEPGLPTVCASYPRKAVPCGQGVEISGSMSCPEIARLCLSDSEAMNRIPFTKNHLPRQFKNVIGTVNFVSMSRKH